MAAQKLVTEDLLSYLKTLPPLLLTRLYENHAACLAVLRELPETARQYLMRMLWLDQAIPISDIKMWCNTTNSSEHQEAVTVLNCLHILKPAFLIGGLQGVIVNPVYKRNMRQVLCGGGSPWLVAGHHGEDKHSRDIEYLNKYADEQWENILNFMVGDRTTSTLKSEVLEVLQHAGLMSRETTSSYITTLGFQFLLVSRSQQVWYFVMQYLKSAQSRELDLSDCLNLIFQLKFSTLGKEYAVKGLTTTQLQFMQHLCQFGLVYQRKKSSKRYYPTKLATNLGSDKQASSQHTPGFILVETNYRVLAYTDSRLHIAILALFCQLQYRFPNMVVGTITRESIHQALVHGITAEQILAFLCMHAHPDMLEKSPIIPPTVSDQIRLWEIERDRLSFQEGVLYSDFLSAVDFDKVYKYAKDLGAVLWSSSARRLVVVHPSRHDEIRQFWKRQKQN